MNLPYIKEAKEESEEESDGESGPDLERLYFEAWHYRMEQFLEKVL
jgi:hypothetical protein